MFTYPVPHLRFICESHNGKNPYHFQKKLAQCCTHQLLVSSASLKTVLLIKKSARCPHESSPFFWGEGASVHRLRDRSLFIAGKGGGGGGAAKDFGLNKVKICWSPLWMPVTSLKWSPLITFDDFRAPLPPPCLHFPSTSKEVTEVAPCPDSHKHKF